VRKTERDEVFVAIQITKVAAQGVKGNSPFNGATGKRRQRFLQKKMRREKKLAHFRRICFFDILQDAHLKFESKARILL
jgi:hypothetical protein